MVRDMYSEQMTQDAVAGQSMRPTAQILIEISVPLSNAAQIELVLTRCCRESGDILLAKDSPQDGRSIRYIVRLVTDEECRMYAHVRVLIAALKNGLIAFKFLYVFLLVEVTLPKYYSDCEVGQLMRTFPLKEQGSDVYADIHWPHTFYITRPLDFLLSDEQMHWLAAYRARYRVL